MAIRARPARMTVAGRNNPRRRGFTLLELMVVVLIITILAVISIPGIVRRMESYRVKRSAEQVAALYRNARLRAMGRGSSVLIRFAGGDYQIREGIVGATIGGPGCAQLPAPSCTDNPNRFDAGNDANQLLGGLLTAGTGVDVTMETNAGPQTQLDVCFTPLGRAYYRTDPASPLVAMTEAPRASVDLTSGAGGLVRDVVILPNGTSRVVAR